MKLTKKQRKFLKTIENPKERKNQKQQFKLQNKFDGINSQIIFIDWIKTTNDNKKMVWHEHNIVESFENMKNSLSKESLRDLTEPNPKEILAKWDEFANNILKDLDKTDNQNIPKEFCVEITEENKEVLDKIWRDFHNQIVGANIGKFLHSNSSFTHCYSSNVSKDDSKKIPVVSTKEFLRYIGKEELIREIVKIIPEHLRENPITHKECFETIRFSTHEKYEKTDNVKPLEFDLPKKEYTIEDMEKCFFAGRITPPKIMTGIKPIDYSFNDFIKNLK